MSGIFRTAGSDKNTPSILSNTAELLKGGVVFFPVVPGASPQNSQDSGSNQRIYLATQNVTSGAVLTEAQHTTAPTITIEQYSRATGLFTARVSAATMTKITGGGGWYYSYDFPGATWNRGDLARVSIEGGVVTVSSKTYTHKLSSVNTVVGLAEILQKIESDVNLAHGSVFSSMVSQGGTSSYVAITAGAVADTYGADAWVELIDGASLPTGDWAVGQIQIRSPTASKSYQVEIGYGNGLDSGTTVIARFNFTTTATAMAAFFPLGTFMRILQSGASLINNIYCRARSDTGGGSFGIHTEIGGY